MVDLTFTPDEDTALAIRIILRYLKKCLSYNTDEDVINAIDNHGEQYWSKVAEGITLLYTYKQQFDNRQAYLDAYIEARNLALGMTDDPYAEDISDELWAVIITYYPMPDFWNSDLEAFKKHSSFKQHFKNKQ